MTRRKPDPSPRDAQDEAARWQLVPLADYSLPPTPAASAARARWTSLRRLFARGGEAAETPARAEADLRGLPEPVLDALVAPVDWSAAAEALQQRRAQDGAANGLTCVVGPPRSGHAALLQRWAAAQGARVVEPPGADEILGGGRAWLDAWPGDDRLWLLPRLEHCWLRHAAGLALVRNLLERAHAGRLGQGVIGCDSWAWAYLRRVAALPTQSVLTLQAFDGPRLAALFRDLLALDDPRPVYFRNAQTGKLVLAVDGGDDGDGGTELQHLAVRARGNAGLARALWRRRLRAEPDSAEGADEADAAAADDADIDATIWLAAPPAAPGLTSNLDEAAALLLHALLLHNGLSAALLAELLPLPPYRIQLRLQWLAALGAVAAGADGRWRIQATAYSAARDLLRAQGFLLDDF